jgi:hypothetical protein
MSAQVKHIVKSKSTDGKITEEVLSNRDQMNRWIKLVKENGYKAISNRTMVVR